jgi:multiple sugar transport system ATP-binding protein
LSLEVQDGEFMEAMTLGHRVCVLRDGRLQQADTPQYLFQAPVNLFVAGFIGSPSMNFVNADLTPGQPAGAKMRPQRR